MFGWGSRIVASAGECRERGWSEVTQSYWRNIATPIIADVLRIHAGATEKELRKALRDAYPFAGRDHHPYKIWCDEIKAQRGLKVAKVKPAKAVEVDPNQATLFLEAVTTTS